MSGSLPTPRDGTQRYLKAIHDRLGDVEARLKDLLDRTPAPPQVGGEGEVELREPAAPAPSGGRGVSSGPVEDTGGPGAAARPARTSSPRKARSTKPPAAEGEPAVKAPKPTQRRTTKPTTTKPTKPKET